MIDCIVEDAPKFLEWCKTRGGVAKWRSADLSNPEASWSTPALTPTGEPTPKPTWQAEDKPCEVETDPAKITVFTDREVARFHVAIKRGGCLNFVLTDASTRKVRAERQKAGKDSYYVFDHATQECVIFAPAGQTNLKDWSDKV